MDNENKETEERGQEILEINPFNIIIPDCCREGWDSCPHVPKKKKPIKNNIGL